jgi:thiamine biosynthesis lipoprotein
LEAALTSAVQAIRSVERQMSLFDPDSGLSRLNRNGVLHRPDAHLRTVLHAASQVSQRSGGAFDVSMQPIWRVWSEAADMGSLPSPRAVQGAQRQVNWRAVEVGTSQIRLNQAGMQLSLNGIAQGYASDLVRASLQAHGIRHALIDAGEVSLLGEGPDAKPWTLDER